MIGKPSMYGASRFGTPVVHLRVGARSLSRVDRRAGCRGRTRSTRPVSGSNAPVFQLPAPHDPGTISVPCLPPGSSLTSDGGVKIGPSTNVFASSRARARSSGVKSIRSSSVRPMRANGARLGRKRLRRAPCARPGSSIAAPAAPRSATPACPVTRSKTYRKPVLLGCITALIRLAVDRDVAERRPGRPCRTPRGRGGPSGSARRACPVFASSATSAFENRLSPGRNPPKYAAVGAVSGM